MGRVQRNPWACSYAETAEDQARLEGFAAGRGWDLVRRYGVGQWDAFLEDLRNIPFGCAKHDGIWWIGSSDLSLIVARTEAAAAVASPERKGISAYLIQELAGQVGVHEKTIYRAGDQGALKYVRVGRKKRISIIEAHRWLATRR